MKILEAPKIRFPDIRKRADGIRVGFKDKSMPLNISDAHELGHYYLHEHYRSFKRIEDWIAFQNDVSSSDLNWFEAQADEFAGRLLVPLDMLKECVEEEVIPHLKRFARKDIDSDNVLEAAAGILFDKCLKSLE